MFRDFPQVILAVFLLMFVALLVLHSDSSSAIQEETVRTMNTVVRTRAMANADHSSRVQEGSFSIDKENFEKEVIDELKGSNINILSEDFVTTFNYLEDEGNLMAIRLILHTHNREYQSTAVVNLVE